MEKVGMCQKALPRQKPETQLSALLTKACEDGTPGKRCCCPSEAACPKSAETHELQQSLEAFGRLAAALQRPRHPLELQLCCL
mmetsp:Transcript_36653/g.67604  ORF Transcript_36653/g.67604 Transcript_36653/m.67604 type:complete len:83 (-) Transcript_36653:163-411(-)